jgi:hypothetical protein
MRGDLGGGGLPDLRLDRQQQGADLGQVGPGRIEPRAEGLDGL